MLIYISTMIAFHKATFKDINKDVIQQKLPMVPSIVIDGLLSRFTETARGSIEYALFTFLGVVALTIS
jgi:DNA-directed RNA polymerase I subunit RPA49